MEEKITTDRTSRRVEPRSSSKKGRWRLLLAGVVILVCGIVIGSGLTIIVVRKMIINSMRHPERIPNRITRRMKRKLDLTDEQAQRVKETVARYMHQLERIRKESRPRVYRQLEMLKEEVAKILNEKQRKVWRKRFKKLEDALPPPTGQ